MVWHLLVTHPALKRGGHEVGVGRRDGPLSAPALSEATSIVVGGAGFIGGHAVDRLLADAGDATGHGVRQLHAPVGGGTSRRTATTPG